jgi:hypothetical protein
MRRAGWRLGPIGEVVGAGLHNVYRKNMGAMTLLGDRGRRGGHDGEAGEAKMLWCSGNLSPEFEVAGGEIWPRTNPSIWSARGQENMSRRCAEITGRYRRS